MSQQLRKKDVNVVRNLNGSLTFFAIIDKHLVQRTYYGYSKREARQRFVGEMKMTEYRQNGGSNGV